MHILHVSKFWQQIIASHEVVAQTALTVVLLQAEQAALQDELRSKAAEADSLHTELDSSVAECHNLTLRLSSTQAELDSAAEETTAQQAELQLLQTRSAAQEADSAAEIDSTRLQASQLGRQLSERNQRLDVLQVCYDDSFVQTYKQAQFGMA